MKIKRPWWLADMAHLHPKCPIDPKLFRRDMKFLNFQGLDPYNSYDDLAGVQADILEFERMNNLS